MEYYITVLYRNAKFLDFDRRMSLLKEIHTEVCGKMSTMGKPGCQVCERT